jgi:hypothetical protein
MRLPLRVSRAERKWRSSPLEDLFGTLQTLAVIGILGFLVWRMGRGGG